MTRSNTGAGWSELIMKISNALVAGCVAIAIGCLAGCPDHETESTTTTEYETTRTQPRVTTAPIVTAPIVTTAPVVTAPAVTVPANSTTTPPTTQSDNAPFSKKTPTTHHNPPYP